MADLLKVTLAPGAVNASLSALTEHGQVKIASGGKIRIEQDLDNGDWRKIYEGNEPILVVDYVGTKLRITNTGTTHAIVRVGAA